MHKVLHDEFGKPLKAEWVDNGIKVTRTDPHTGELNSMTLEVIMQDIVDYYNPRIPKRNKIWTKENEKEFLDRGVIR